MTDLPIYEGVMVDITFAPPGPLFGDLFQICGYDHPKFPPTGSWEFGKLAELGFEQVDDYFGIRSHDTDGSDVVVWLYPLIDGEDVFHHGGPFDGVRLHFNVLKNPPRRVEQFLRCVSAFAERGAQPGPDLAAIRAEIDAITEYWRSQGIEVGSPAARDIDY